MSDSITLNFFFLGPDMEACRRLLFPFWSSSDPESPEIDSFKFVHSDELLPPFGDHTSYCLSCYASGSSDFDTSVDVSSARCLRLFFNFSRFFSYLFVRSLSSLAVPSSSEPVLPFISVVLHSSPISLFGKVRPDCCLRPTRHDFISSQRRTPPN